MHPDYERSRWWAAADNYLAMAHFCFERTPRNDYVWYMLLGWAECMGNLEDELCEMWAGDRSAGYPNGRDDAEAQKGVHPL